MAQISGSNGFKFSNSIVSIGDVNACTNEPVPLFKAVNEGVLGFNSVGTWVIPHIAVEATATLGDLNDLANQVSAIGGLRIDHVGAFTLRCRRRDDIVTVIVVDKNVVVIFKAHGTHQLGYLLLGCLIVGTGLFINGLDGRSRHLDDIAHRMAALFNQHFTLVCQRIAGVLGAAVGFKPDQHDR